MRTATPRHRCRRRSRSRGVTLVEVILGLAMTAMIGLTIVSLLSALSTGTSDRRDVRRRNLRREVLANRLSAAIRSSSAVLASDEHCLILWAGDSRKNGRPDLSELRRIEWNVATRQLRYFEPPADMSDADDVTYDPTTDFIAVTDALRGTPSLAAHVWASRVTAWSCTAPEPADNARIVNYALTITGPAGAFSFRSSASVRGTSGKEQ